MTKAVSPTYEEVMESVEAVASANARTVTRDEIGKSVQGRPIPLLTVTDPDVPVKDKQVLFITGGTHGSEEVGRAITLAFARWLTEPQNATHLSRQVFLIVPCVNPDGAIADSYHNADNVNIYTSFPLWEEPKTVEAAAIWEVGKRWIPDAYADCHGLAGGAMGDSEYIHNGYGGDFAIANGLYVANHMNEAAERAGYPQRTPSLMVLRNEQRCAIPDKFASEMHALALTVETTENYYPLEDSIRSGLARLGALVEMGERIHCFQPYPNYPCDVITGSRPGALMPYGADYESRRRNRKDTCTMIREGVPHCSRMAADKGNVARIEMVLEDTVRTLPEGVAMQLAVDRRARLDKVTWNGQELSPAAAGNGWTSWTDAGARVVRAEIAGRPVTGSNMLEVYYDVPFKPHVQPK
ncbi:MAG: hypothetical protein JW909_00755 [Planctomycetes bacterium]|nr:hypothetical protein [Planctomycetota bacterium]